MTVAKIGPDKNSVTDVLIEPHVEFMQGATGDRTVTSQDRFVGSPRCRWTYPDRILEGEQFYQLKSLVGSGASASVVIDIPTQEINTTSYRPEIVTYNAIMHWPEREIRLDGNHRWQIPNGILFTNLTPLE